MNPPNITRRRFIQVNWVSLFSLQAMLQPAMAQVRSDLGGASLVLPTPEKFVAIKPGEQFFDLMSSMVPQANELLAIFIGEPDLQSLRRGDGKAISTYFLIQSPKVWAGKRFSQSDFDRFKKQIREKQANQVASSGRPTQTQLDDMLKELRARGGNMTVSVSQPVSLGVYFETDAAIGSTILENAAVSSEGKTTQIRKVTAYIIAFVKNKIVFLYLYRDFIGMADVHWVQDEAHKWAEELKLRNI